MEHGTVLLATALASGMTLGSIHTYTPVLLYHEQPKVSQEGLHEELYEGLPL